MPQQGWPNFGRRSPPQVADFSTPPHTYAEDDGAEQTITIVGVDEADLDKGKVSWVSPVARAILKSEVGDRVAVRSPAGRREVEIVSIGYPVA